MNPQVDILIVDDREDSLIALEAVLNDARYNLVRARSGKEALGLVPRHEFALILMDVQMPGMDGFQTAAEIKKIEQHAMIPIIFVTAINKDDDYIYRGYGQGAVDYIFKPFSARILRSKVGVFVDLYLKTKALVEQAERLREAERRERYMRLAQLEVESLRRYQNLADSIPHVVWRAKPDGTMDYLNRIWTDSTGLSEEQSSGNGWQAAFPDEDLRIFLKTWVEAMASGSGFQLETRINNRAGEARWHLIRAVLERRANGEPLAWIGTCTDIHERREMEQKLVRAQQTAEAANLAKTSFLANMSHEIRTPLNSIMGFAELIMCDKMTPEEQFRSLATIRKNGQLLQRIIDEILDISKVEAGHMRFEAVEVDVRRLFWELRSLLHVQASEKGIGLDFRSVTNIPASICSDPSRYRQILVNIIGNAIKFTDHGGVKVEVSWLPSANVALGDECGVGEEGVLRCRVVDTGIGIEGGEASNLFQPFVQVDGSATRRFGGTGLGLALSRRLAHALNGNVYLEKSSAEAGSVFVVDIGARTFAKAGYVTTLDLGNEKPMHETSSPSRILENLDVLVVDDSGDNRTLISQFLKAAGARVDCAVDGVDGIEKALAKDYHLVLMDIQMPRMDGYEATARLRSREYARPIIALTAHAMMQEREHSLRAGCNDHLTKPIDRRTLVEQVARHARAEA